MDDCDVDDDDDYDDDVDEYDDYDNDDDDGDVDDDDDYDDDDDDFHDDGDDDEGLPGVRSGSPQTRAALGVPAIPEKYFDTIGCFTFSSSFLFP